MIFLTWRRTWQWEWPEVWAGEFFVLWKIWTLRSTYSVTLCFLICFVGLLANCPKWGISCGFCTILSFQNGAKLLGSTNETIRSSIVGIRACKSKKMFPSSSLPWAAIYFLSNSDVYPSMVVAIPDCGSLWNCKFFKTFISFELGYSA